MYERRLKAIEAAIQQRGSAVTDLHAAGVSKDRLREITDRAGEIRWPELTDEELDVIAPDEGETVCGVPWSELTDQELTEIAEGEPPEEVLSMNRPSRRE